jgi:DHA2 family multidrug resistance protein-like MFS transporter
MTRHWRLVRRHDLGRYFTALSADSESTHWLEGVITFAGRQDNVAIRQAALIALAFNLLMVVAAIVSIMLTVPKGRQRGA